jgi:hypothetical protein
MALQMVVVLYNRMRTHQPQKLIMVMTPYKAQCDLLVRYLPQSRQRGEQPCEDPMRTVPLDPLLRVCTTDSSQGSEADIVIISTVRSNGNKEIGFVSDQFRANVLLSRAKEFMFIICDDATLRGNQPWTQILDSVPALPVEDPVYILASQVAPPKTAESIHEVSRRCREQSKKRTAENPLPDFVSRWFISPQLPQTPHVDEKLTHWFQNRRQELEGGVKEISIEWQEFGLVSTATEKTLLSMNFFVALWNGGEFDHQDMLHLQETIESNCADISIAQATSLHNGVLIDYLYSQLGRITRHLTKITKDYESGIDVFKLAAIYNYTPLGLLALMLNKRFGDELKPFALQQLAKSGASGDFEISPRDQDQLRQAIKIEHVKPVGKNLRTARSIADRFENDLASFLQVHGVRIARKKDLKKCGFHCTPDILCLDNVFINGRRVTWLDAKPFFGSTCCEHRMHSMRAQVTRYNRQFEFGALVFQCGYSENMRTTDMMCLNGQLIERGKTIV